jgi:gamma-glutamyltranspeptidase/glutathione hydrolase
VGAGKAIDPYKYTIVKKADYSKASVSSAHPLASHGWGGGIMKAGGNAFDAAIATQLALSVVYPGAGNIGGGGFLLGRKSNGELIGIDYREAAPEKASRDMYLDKNGNVQLAIVAQRAPRFRYTGNRCGIICHASYAKLPFKQLVQPAIDLAEKGFAISEREASSSNGTREAFVKYSTRPTALGKRRQMESR